LEVRVIENVGVDDNGPCVLGVYRALSQSYG